MAVVPKYEPSVEQAALPSFRQESVATPALLGGAADSLANASKGLQTAGQGVAAVAYHMQEKENADAVLQAETKWKTEYVEFQADIGKNRKGDFAKGVTEDTKRWWDESAKKHTEALANDVQRKLLINRMSAVRLNSFESVSKFEAAERERSLDLSATASKVASIDLAASSGDPASVEVALRDIAKINAFTAARKGITDPTVLEAMRIEDTTKLHKQVIQTLVKKNPMAAKAYFEQYKDQIRGSERAEVGEFADKATAESIGVATAGEIWAASGPKGDKDAANLDVLEQQARDKFKDDPFALKATISNLRERYQAFNTGRRERQDNIENAVNSALLRGASMTQVRAMPEFLQMAPEKARAIETFMENRAYTRAARADAEESRAQRRLRREGISKTLELSDPDVLVSLTRKQVENLLPVIGEENTILLVNRHDQLTKSSEALSAARLDNNTFKAMLKESGMDANPKADSEEETRVFNLRRAVDARLSMEARAKGRPLTPEERVKHAQAAFDDTVRVPGFFGYRVGSGTERPASALTKDERTKAFVISDRGERVRIKDIPPAFIDEAEQSLSAAGRPITQKSVAEMWLLNRGTWRKQPSGLVERIPK